MSTRANSRFMLCSFMLPTSSTIRTEHTWSLTIASNHSIRRIFVIWCQNNFVIRWQFWYVHKYPYSRKPRDAHGCLIHFTIGFFIHLSKVLLEFEYYLNIHSKFTPLVQASNLLGPLSDCVVHQIAQKIMHKQSVNKNSKHLDHT